MRTYPKNHNTPAGNVKGFSLVELMISITIGLFLLIGMTALLVSNSNTRNEMEKGGRQVENGRYAIQVLSDDLQHAGYYGEFSDASGTGTSDYCSTDLAVIKANMIFPVYGVDNAGAKPTCATATSFVSGRDILVIRRAGTGVAITCTGTPCAAPVAAAQHYIQTTPAEYRLGLGSEGAATFNLKQVDGLTPALLRAYLTHIYFIDKENNVPILKRAELVNGAFTPESTYSMVEGIDNFQVEYGVDANNDGAPDGYVTANTVSTANNWKNVVSVRVYVLVRNIDITAGYTDTKTYTLGMKADGTPNTVGPFGDHFKRHVYTSVVRLNNPSGRREL